MHYLGLLGRRHLAHGSLDLDAYRFPKFQKNIFEKPKNVILRVSVEIGAKSYVGTSTGSRSLRSEDRIDHKNVFFSSKINLPHFNKNGIESRGCPLCTQRPSLKGQFSRDFGDF